MNETISVKKTFVILTLLSLMVAGCGIKLSNQLGALLPSPTPSPSPVEKIKKVYAYAGSQYSGNKIFGFSLDSSSGALTPTTQQSVTGNPFAMIMAATRNKKFLVSANYSSHNLSSYSINPSNGELTLVEDESLGASTSPVWIVAHPTKDVLYVANAGTSAIAIVDVDAATGDLTVRGTVAAGSGVTALIFNKDATVLYSADQGADRIGIYTVGADGSLTLSSTVSMTAGSQVNSFAVSADGRFLYTANWGTETVSAYAISGVTLTQIGSDLAVGAGGPYMIQVTPDGRQLLTGQPYGNSLVRYDLDVITGEPGNPVAESITGAINVNFYKNFSFILRWGNSTTFLPILTRSYSTGQGVGVTDLAASEGFSGLYQLTFVEVDP